MAKKAPLPRLRRCQTSKISPPLPALTLYLGQVLLEPNTTTFTKPHVDTVPPFLRVPPMDLSVTPSVPTSSIRTSLLTSLSPHQFHRIRSLVGRCSRLPLLIPAHTPLYQV